MNGYISENPEFLKNLPQSVKELVKLIGYKETRKLLLKYGGERKYIPISPDSNSKIKEILSMQSIITLSQIYGGESLELPKADSLIRIERDYDIYIKSSQGVSRVQLGRDYGLTTRQIGNIRNRIRGIIENRHSRDTLNNVPLSQFGR